MIKKVIFSIKIKILDFYLYVVNDIFAKKFMKQPKIVKVDEFIDYILNKQISISRFGDGEFSLITGENLKFQDYNLQLAKELKEILVSNNDKLLVCIPDIFEGLNQYTPRANCYWRKYLHRKRKFVYDLLNLDKVYYDSFISRFYIDYLDKSQMDMKVNKIKKLWFNKDILIVEGEKSRLGVGNDFFDSSLSISRIICPSISAYNKIDEIERAIIKHSANKLILLALGPTATVLASRLTKYNIYSLDIGHIDIEYEWYLMNATEKCVIKNKYIGEIPGGDSVDDSLDVAYLSQIVERII